MLEASDLLYRIGNLVNQGLHLMSLFIATVWSTWTRWCQVKQLNFSWGGNKEKEIIKQSLFSDLEMQ
jgi:hypothetical protein